MMKMNKKTYEKFEKIVGQENISKDPAVLDGYAYQWGAEFVGEVGNRFSPAKPEAVILPKSTEEIQSIVKSCNESNLKFKAHSTGWGVWSTAKDEGTVLLDLRRMNELIEINEEETYAVVEPYVTWAQLQSECMKKGLNCTTIGAGSNTSVLASVTCMAGIGHNNVSMGYNARNVLGVEWVLPDGDILKLGSLDSNAGWISGDGPGPSLRGIMRGLYGTMGGLGVFTKCAVRLYDWPGPSEFKVENITPGKERIKNYPDNIEVFAIHFDSWEDRDEAIAKIGESEIAYSGAVTERPALFGLIGSSNKEMSELLKWTDFARILFPQVIITLVLAANSERELDYKKKVLDDILEETNGRTLDDLLDTFDSLPHFLFDLAKKLGDFESVFEIIKNRRAFKDPLTLFILKTGSYVNRIVFGVGGSFTTNLCGNFTTRRTLTPTQTKAIEIKKEYLGNNLFVEDMGEGGWGPLHIDQGHLGWLESGTTFDPWNPEAVKAMIEQLERINEACAEENIILPFISQAQVDESKGKSPHDTIGPRMNTDYRPWQKRIKKAFDPKNASDPSDYIEPEKSE